MKTIILKNNGKAAVVDDEDYERVVGIDWYGVQSRPNAKMVVRTGTKKGEFRYMHRVILGLKQGDLHLVEHKDGNGLNNQKGNLRAYYPIQGKEF